VNCRGLPFDDAIQTYVNTVGERHSRDLFSVIKKIHMSSSMNVEALRKLVSIECVVSISTSYHLEISRQVKKFDKVCLIGESCAA